MSAWRLWGTSNRDQRALFAQLVQCHTQALFALAYRLCGDRELAEELVQETFYQGWKGIGQLREPAHGKAWLMRILRRRYARWARGRQRENEVHATLAAEPAGSLAADAPVARLVERDTLQQALDRLPEHYRLTFVLVFVGGLSCEEAARELDVPIGTVLSRLHRARQRLRETIEQLDNPAKRASVPETMNPSMMRLRLGGEA